MAASTIVTSGTWNFSPEVAAYISESVERCGINPASMDVEHLISIRRSLNFMFAAWTARGFKQPWMTTYSVTLTQGQIQIPLISPAIDVFHSYLTRDGYDVETYKISRSDYESIPDKMQQGRPTMYWVNNNTVNANGAPVIYIWQASQNDTDIWNSSVFNRAQDAGQSNNTLFIPYVWTEAAVCGLAAKFAQKWRPERYAGLKVEAAEEFKIAMDSTREKANTRIRVRTNGWGWK